mmetsp:Transcript_6160/g.12175  ORF Transcript_6160/g.12175 Transcript_6160/m.12175 type:complete len:443 (-) Transcript_6160:113-1441(-)
MAPFLPNFLFFSCLILSRASNLSTFLFLDNCLLFVRAYMQFPCKDFRAEAALSRERAGGGEREGGGEEGESDRENDFFREYDALSVFFGVSQFCSLSSPELLKELHKVGGFHPCPTKRLTLASFVLFKLHRAKYNNNVGSFDRTPVEIPLEFGFGYVRLQVDVIIEYEGTFASQGHFMAICRRGGAFFYFDDSSVEDFPSGVPSTERLKEAGERASLVLCSVIAVGVNPDIEPLAALSGDKMEGGSAASAAAAASLSTGNEGVSLRSSQSAHCRGKAGAEASREVELQFGSVVNEMDPDSARGSGEPELKRPRLERSREQEGTRLTGHDGASFEVWSQPIVPSPGSASEAGAPRSPSACVSHHSNTWPYNCSHTLRQKQNAAVAGGSCSDSRQKAPTVTRLLGMPHPHVMNRYAGPQARVPSQELPILNLPSLFYSSPPQKT